MSDASDLVTVGAIVGLHGVRGELKVRILTDFPERFEESPEMLLDGRPVHIEGVRFHKGQALIKLQGVDTADAAQPFVGRELQIHESELKPLPEGTHYVFQLMGLDVYTTAGERLGKLIDVMQSGAVDIYVVEGDTPEPPAPRASRRPRGLRQPKPKQWMIPAAREYVKRIDMAARRMEVELKEGLEVAP